MPDVMRDTGTEKKTMITLTREITNGTKAKITIEDEDIKIVFDKFDSIPQALEQFENLKELFRHTKAYGSTYIELIEKVSHYSE